MSGVYIKGMEMPEYGCDNCFLRAGNYCGRIEKDESVVEYARKNERHPDCPLVNVPQHGRLIDADALYEDCALNHGYEVMATTSRINEYMQLEIDAAPTIIPASGGTEDE